ncbi:protein outspread isoform X4 [Periplaneta americana]|uniref:protein outspread isoform X4 n=1 Tax=Periplaneta americana TaxID=6978 RepID=UPI0037E766A9
MSATLMRSECRKFAPNIFNKSKCTNCFRQKEEHSAEALQSNRATRKVAKCGYLFVAPGWDFSNPLNRTKRWQRRWFVLYDDGELSYSVDEHPETVPQASIDMNKVLEVTDGEEVTGHAFSLAITAPDRVHFVKGTCREECRWWGDVLSVFPRSKLTSTVRGTHEGRHKRNATFPGGQATSILQKPPSVRAATPNEPRPRFNSCHTEPSSLRHSPAPSWLPVEAEAFPTRDVTTPTEAQPPPEIPATVPVETRKVYRDQPASSASPPTRDKIQSEEKVRTRRVANREKRGVKTGRSFSEDFSGMLPTWRERSKTESTSEHQDARRILLDEYTSECDKQRDEKLKDIAESLTRPRYRRNNQSRSPSAASSTVYHTKPTRDGECSEEEQKKGYERMGSPVLPHSDHIDGGDKLVRGDPDGCGLDISTHRYSPSSELRVDLPAEDLLNIKKGWLMKQGLNKEWNKHWFVLRGAALMYYRDPTAEDKGILDGVIDLSGVNSITEVQVARNYGFQTLTWDDRRYVLSAVTAGIRANWMSAVRRAAGLQDPSSAGVCERTLSVGEKLERELDSSQQLASPIGQLEREPSIVLSASLTPRSILFSSDEEYRTASEGGRRESEDWGEPLAPLPPSPPLNRTPISRVKEKARSRSNSRSRVYKRSKSSPPSSRRSTLDSVRADDLLLACCGELPESDAEESVGVDSVKSSLCDTDNQSSEMEDLKRQLSVALCEVSNAEKELLRLRQRKSDSSALEQQLQDLLKTLERTEEELRQKTKEATEAEALRKSYTELLREHEEVLTQWRQQASGDEWRELYQQLEARYHEDSEEWQQKLTDAESALAAACCRCDALTREAAEATSLGERLARGIEENEALYRRVRELEGRAGSTSSSSAGGSNGLTTSRDKGRSVDSLSDLTNIDLDLDLAQIDKERLVEEYEDLRGRFEKAVAEIRAMKRELRESHALYDDLELTVITLRQDGKRREEANDAQSALMAARVEDLTLKLTAAEKQVRGLKQKLSKSDSREKRRSLSLKGRESFQICKELEEKLAELEAKITSIETGQPLTPTASPRPMKHARSESPQSRRDTSNGEGGSKGSSRIRRKSLDSATSSEPMKVLIRLTSLESKVAKAAGRIAKKVEDDTEQETSHTKSMRLSSPKRPHQVEVSVEPAPDTLSAEEERLANLENAVVTTRTKVQECLNLVATFKSPSPKSHLSYSDGFIYLENRLGEVKDTLEKCSVIYKDVDMKISSSCGSVELVRGATVQCVIGRLENLLQCKLKELATKKSELINLGRYDQEARMHLLAEKLAYESVLVGRIVQAVASCEDTSSGFRKRVLDSEIVECNRLISELKSKLKGNTESKSDSYETSLAHLTKVLSARLVAQGRLASANGAVIQRSELTGKEGWHLNVSSTDATEMLLKHQQELEACMREYRMKKLEHLAQTLAIETLSLSNEHEQTKNDVTPDKKLEQQRTGRSPTPTLEDRRIREAWTMAQETVNHELIQAEISHVTMRCGQAYETSLAKEQEAMFSFLASQRAVLEQWSDTVEGILRQEMESGIDELTRKYEEYVAKLKKDKTVRSLNHSEEAMLESRRLLAEFADMTAHKALIDARIAVICNETPPMETSDNSITNDNSDELHIASSDEVISRLLADPEQDEFRVDPTMRMEFQYLFEQFSQKCRSSVSRGFSGKRGVGRGGAVVSDEVHIQSVKDSLVYLQKELQLALDKCNIHVEEEHDCGSGEDPWDDMCSKCDALRRQITSLIEYVVQGRDCNRCQQLQETLHRLTSEHEQELEALQRCQEREMARLRGELEQQRHSLVCQHEQEQAQLKERARRLERRLGTLDSEYAQQVENLRAAYHKTLSAGLERDVDGEENIRQRYQAEIEQLRALCEKGLVAMENSHRRIIAELEEKHRQELEQLRHEKEQALAEETQATLAALDAMRKAHETEVQKEITKFKSEFIKKMQSTHDIGALHKEHEAEMEEIKQEILSLSERYSVKCVESASLEEQLGVVTKQLAQAQQHIQQLDARNKQLRAHLVSEASELEADSGGNAAQLLQQRERELEQKCEEMDQLQHELDAAKTHGEQLSALCAQLSDGYMCTEHCHSNRMGPLWERLRQLAAAWPPHSTELMRSPKKSCHRNSSSSTFLSVAPLRSPSPNPLSGMVAERKKMFEP